MALLPYISARDDLQNRGQQHCIDQRTSPLPNLGVQDFHVLQTLRVPVTPTHENFSKMRFPKIRGLYGDNHSKGSLTSVCFRVPWLWKLLNG